MSDNGNKTIEDAPEYIGDHVIFWVDGMIYKLPYDRENSLVINTIGITVPKGTKMWVCIREYVTPRDIPSVEDPEPNIFCSDSGINPNSPSTES